MNATRWMELGYKVLIRNSVVFLVRPESGKVWHRPVDNGRWMDEDNKHMPLIDGWTETHLDELPDGFKANFDAAIRDCYCGEAGIARCDFCTSMRTPDGAPWNHGLHLAESGVA